MRKVLKNFNYTLLALTVFLILGSCGQGNREEKEKLAAEEARAKREKERIEKRNTFLFDSLIKRYDAINFESVEGLSSYSSLKLKNLVHGENIAFQGCIIDVFNNDDGYFLDIIYLRGYFGLDIRFLLKLSYRQSQLFQDADVFSNDKVSNILREYGKCSGDEFYIVCGNVKIKSKDDVQIMAEGDLVSAIKILKVSPTD